MKEEEFEFHGTITEVNSDYNFKVKLDKNAEFGINDNVVILAYAAGLLKKKRVKISLMDRVIVVMNRYSLEKGRIKSKIQDAR